MNATSPARSKHEPRVEDDALVRGHGRFMDDPRLPNQAYAAFVRSPHAHARVLAVKTEAARAAKQVLAVLTAEDIKAAGVGGISRHPPVVGRGGAKMVMPFRPALAGDKVDACRRCGGHGGGGNARRSAGRRRAGRSRLRGIAGGGRPGSRDERQDATLSGRAGQSLRRLAGPGGQRAERARGRRHHRQGAACRARQRHPPAPGGGLDGNARRHRRLRQGERQLHAARLLAERRWLARSGGLHHGRAERKIAGDHRRCRRRLRHEDDGLSGIRRGDGGRAQGRAAGALAIDAFGSLHERLPGARRDDACRTRARRQGQVPSACACGISATRAPISPTPASTSTPTISRVAFPACTGSRKSTSASPVISPTRCRSRLIAAPDARRRITRSSARSRKPRASSAWIRCGCARRT